MWPDVNKDTAPDGGLGVGVRVRSSGSLRWRLRRLRSGPAAIASWSPAVEIEEIALCFQRQAPFGPWAGL